MSRTPDQRLEDILAAVDRARSYAPYLRHDDAQLAAMAYDGVLRNLAVIGEAVRTLPDWITADTAVPWSSIAGLRNVVVHEYFRVDPDVVTDVLDNHLGPLAERLSTLRSDDAADG